MRIATVATFMAGVLLLAACGETTEQRVATGAGAGLLAAGPVGAAAGGAAGLAVDEAVD